MAVYKSGYFVPALSLALFAAMFRFGPGGVSWFWTDQPIAAVMLAGTSAVFWVLLFLSLRKRSA